MGCHPYNPFGFHPVLLLLVEIEEKLIRNVEGPCLTLLLSSEQCKVKALASVGPYTSITTRGLAPLGSVNEP